MCSESSENAIETFFSFFEIGFHYAVVTDLELAM